MRVYVCVKGRGGQMKTRGWAEERVDLSSLWRKNGQDVVYNGTGSNPLCTVLLGIRGGRSGYP